MPLKRENVSSKSFFSGASRCSLCRLGLMVSLITILSVAYTLLSSPTIVRALPPGQSPSVEEGAPKKKSEKSSQSVNQASKQWFQDAKFGLFIHWGVYSVLGQGEWVMNNRKMPISEYEKLPAQFNPTEFDPAEWVAL